MINTLNEGDKVIVFSNYGRKYKLSKIKSVSYFNYILDDGEEVSMRDEGKGISFFSYNDENLQQYLVMHEIKKVIYALHYNKKSQKLIDNDMLKNLKGLFREGELDDIASSGFAMGSLKKESSFLHGLFNENHELKS